MTKQSFSPIFNHTRTYPMQMLSIHIGGLILIHLLSKFCGSAFSAWGSDKRPPSRNRASFLRLSVLGECSSCFELRQSIAMGSIQAESCFEMGPLTTLRFE
ncbi:hypothetical protein AVEN_270572-1 [Araneus ventricosus]|uniref:Uncharacterized protein n=1 Tax=Araneus ventricosus TaxID=182803 RepID=A0A4Y2B5K9_ARAVE|nr:hypothetical protein AVEN_270572-1 [Araneus ventricosus]